MKILLMIAVSMFVGSCIHNNSGQLETEPQLVKHKCSEMGFPAEEFLPAPNVEELGWNKVSLKAVVGEAIDLEAAAFMIVTCGRVVVSYGKVSTPYKVHSVRKSLINSLFGIYYDRKVIDIEKNLNSFGIDDIGKLSAAEKHATVRDLLRSRSGVYLEAGGEIAEMKEERPKRYSYRPGEFFYYNNWDFNVLGTIFMRATGKNIFESFKTEIAEKIGMQDFETALGRLKTEKQSEHPVYQFRMSARDLARYGHLFLARGSWSGQRILSADWIEKSFTLSPTDSAATGTKSGFGFLWWGVYNQGLGLQPGIMAASGLGTQKIYIIPQIQSVVVFLKDTDQYDPSHPEKTVIGTQRHDLFLSKILSARHLAGK